MRPPAGNSLINSVLMSWHANTATVKCTFYQKLQQLLMPPPGVHPCACCEARHHTLCPQPGTEHEGTLTGPFSEAWHLISCRLWPPQAWSNFLGAVTARPLPAYSSVRPFPSLFLLLIFHQCSPQLIPPPTESHLSAYFSGNPNQDADPNWGSSFHPSNHPATQTFRSLRGLLCPHYSKAHLLVTGISSHVFPPSLFLPSFTV